VIAVETAREMRAAVEAALPADAAVMAAAVADWHVANASDSKIKKDGSGRSRQLQFAENPDILAWISQLQAGAPGAGRGLCGRNRQCAGKRQRQARPQGLRLDRRQ
jgi:phosphopantothenoylcysteine decarboxylase/phosphopantothenate--cysteine ligase